jgi:DNA polymerase III alpha subunit
VVVEDVSGQVEVLVWPRVYSQTEELWKEGNELIIEGKVRVRDDEISITCDNAKLYEPPREENGPAAKAEPRQAEPAIEKPAPMQAERHRLIINIHQTSDEQGDITRLNRIVALLKTYQGRDEVRLNVQNGGAAIPLRLPNILTGYCQELRSRLAELVGDEGLKVERIQ